MKKWEKKNTRLQLSQGTLFAGLLKKVLPRFSMCVKSWLGHFRVPRILNFQRQNLSCENEFYFHRKEGQFSSQKPRSNPRFEQEAWENSEWAIFPDCFTLPRYALWLIEKRGAYVLKFPPDHRSLCWILFSLTKLKLLSLLLLLLLQNN